MRSTPTSDLGLVQLLNLAQDMLCVAGFDGYFKQVNPAWERALGWTAEDDLPIGFRLLADWLRERPDLWGRFGITVP